jgi:3-hydroxyacyl-[acyl-carrier-protein] dehydratase
LPLRGGAICDRPYNTGAGADRLAEPIRAAYYRPRGCTGRLWFASLPILPRRGKRLFLSKADIQKIIPHREPFVLVDEIVELDPDRCAVGIVRNVADYDFFAQLRTRNRGSGDLMLVDAVRPNSSNTGAEGTIENVAALEPFFEGHFPGRPILPGALLLEALAEVAHHYLLRTQPFRRGAFLKGIDNWRFRQVIVPGDRLELYVEQIDPGVMRARATTSGKTAAEGRFTFVPGDAVASPLPGQATLPGALVIEALAEVGAVAALGVDGRTEKLAFLAGIEDWEFYSPVRAGRELTLRASIVELRRSFGKGHFVALAAEGPVAEGDLVFGLG